MKMINNRPAYTRDELLKMVKDLRLLTEFELPERKSIFEVRLYDKAHKYCNVYVELILQINFELAERYKGRKNTILEITGCMVHCSEHTNDAKKLSLFLESGYITFSKFTLSLTYIMFMTYTLRFARLLTSNRLALINSIRLISTSTLPLA